MKNIVETVFAYFSFASFTVTFIEASSQAATTLVTDATTRQSTGTAELTFPASTAAGSTAAETPTSNLTTVPVATTYLETSTPEISTAVDTTASQVTSSFPASTGMCCL